MKKYLSIALVTIIIILTLVYSLRKNTPDFEQYAAGTERKTAFFNYFLPLIAEKNQQITQIREKLHHWRDNSSNIGWWDARQLDDLANQYRVKAFTIDDDASWQNLLLKVDVLPPSLVLAQAANESAWGTSRFATLGNNYFGQWCYKKGCGLVPNKRGNGKVHEVAVFDSPQESLESYMQNLNSHPAYKPLRKIRDQRHRNNQAITGIALAAGLASYSERGEHYIKELRDMIHFNKLSEYDEYINNKD